MSRQNYYATRKRRFKQEVNKKFIVNLANTERRLQPRLGGRKLYFLLKKQFDKNGVAIGRDRFFNVLRENKMLVEKKKKKPRTTNSRHCLPVFHNLIQDMKITAPNQVWCSDLTYISTQEGFMYASLITDMHSRKIVGAYIGDSLESFGCITALEKALKDLPVDKKPIHHSDRGTQYCCHEYINRLLDNGLKVSMTEINHCYENAMAERINGILKDEYELDHVFSLKKQAVKVFYEAVEIYNYKRPHLSLDYQFPGQVHSKAA
jgi:putative transposase